MDFSFETQTALREEAEVFSIQKARDVRFLAGVVGGIFDAQMVQEIQVLPHGVLVLDVPQETFAVTIEDVGVDAADEALESHVLFFSSFGVTQFGEGVDDNTEEDVEEHDDHEGKEGEIEELAGEELGLLPGLGFHDVADTAALAETSGEHEEEAVGE